MSTEHITAEIEAGLKAARKLKEKNAAERQRLLAEQEKADQALVDNLEAAAALAAAAQQQHEDESEGRQHRLAQANRIAGVVDEPAPEPQASDEPAPASSDGNDNGGNTSVQPAVQDHDGDEDALPWEQRRQDRQAEPEPDQAPRFDGRPRSFVQWLLALLGGWIGLVVGVKTHSWLFEGAFSGSTYDVVSIVWVVIWIAFGFGLGGWIGWRIDHRHRREH